jgi:hypothetical protein
MTTLPNDVCRCTGVDGGFVCPERDTCKRYRAFTTDYSGKWVYCTAAVRDCGYKIEVENG